MPFSSSPLQIGCTTYYVALIDCRQTGTFDKAREEVHTYNYKYETTASFTIASLARCLATFDSLILASLFRFAGPGPPSSSFPAGLQPVASNDRNGRDATKRVSRIDLDFEQALSTGGTVLLTEGVDVDALGADAGTSTAPKPVPIPPAKERRSPRNSLLPPPPTPVTIHHPTPTPAAASGTSPVSRQPTSSPSSSSNDLFYDAEDLDMQTKRRSLYRSPGTSSSPDLATLLRKAKERGIVVPANARKEKQMETPPPLPQTVANLSERPPPPSPTTRRRSSTSTDPPPRLNQTHTLEPPKTKYNTMPDLPSDTEASGTEWPNPRSRKVSKSSKVPLSTAVPFSSPNVVKQVQQPPKASVRAKTSAFFGRMLGTTRERSVSLSSHLIPCVFSHSHDAAHRRDRSLGAPSISPGDTSST
jgi:hypothetical protein